MPPDTAAAAAAAKRYITPKIISSAAAADVAHPLNALLAQITFYNPRPLVVTNDPKGEGEKASRIPKHSFLGFYCVMIAFMVMWLQLGRFEVCHTE